MRVALVNRPGSELRVAGEGNPPTTRSRLLDASLDLFFAAGSAQTSVQEIVEHAGLTKGAFYHHFASKQDLLLLLHDEILVDELTRCKAVIDRGGSATETMWGIIIELVLSVEEHLAAVSVWLREWRLLSEEQFAIVKPKRDTLEGMLIDVIRCGTDSGEFRILQEPRIVAFGIIGMCSWVHEWFQPTGRVSGREIGQMYADIIIAGLRGPGTPEDQLTG